MSTNLPVALLTAMQNPVAPARRDEYFTPVFRLSFPHLDQAWAGTGADAARNTPAYSCIGIFHDKANLASLMETSQQKLIAKFGPNAMTGLQHGAYRFPVRRKLVMADKFQGYEGDGFFCSLRARQEAPPVCIAYLGGKQTPLQPGAIERHLYAGCYCYAVIQIYAYDNVGKGVGWGMQTLVKVADGERMGGGKAVTQEEALASITDVMLPPGLLPDGTGPIVDGQLQPGSDLAPWEGRKGTQLGPDDDLTSFLNG